MATLRTPGRKGLGEQHPVALWRLSSWDPLLAPVEGLKQGSPPPAVSPE